MPFILFFRSFARLRKQQNERTIKVSSLLYLSFRKVRPTSKSKTVLYDNKAAFSLLFLITNSPSLFSD